MTTSFCLSRLENKSADLITTPVPKLEFPSDRERKPIHRLPFQILVGVEILADGVDVGVAEEFLDRDDVAPARDQGEGF